MYSQQQQTPNYLQQQQPPPIGFEALDSTPGQTHAPPNYKNPANLLPPGHTSGIGETYLPQMGGRNDVTTGNRVESDTLTRNGEEMCRLMIVATNQRIPEPESSGCWACVKLCCTCVGLFLCWILSTWLKIRRKIDRRERRKQQYWSN